MIRRIVRKLPYDFHFWVRWKDCQLYYWLSFYQRDGREQKYYHYDNYNLMQYGWMINDRHK